MRRQALQLRLFHTMGEIASEQNSTIILPIPIDLLRPYLSGPDGSGGDYEARARWGQREEEEEAVGDAPSVIPTGEGNP